MANCGRLKSHFAPIESVGLALHGDHTMHAASADRREDLIRPRLVPVAKAIESERSYAGLESTRNGSGFPGLGYSGSLKSNGSVQRSLFVSACPRCRLGACLRG